MLHAHTKKIFECTTQFKQDNAVWQENPNFIQGVQNKTGRL